MLVVAGAGYLALRPPYPVRQFQRGNACCEQGDYATGIEYFNQSLRSDPKQGGVLFARGRALSWQGDFPAALADFRAASLLADDPKTDACIGYCLAKRNQHDAAIYYDRQAIEKGFQPPGVLNNLGFSCRQLNRLDSAEDYLHRAIAVDPSLAAAHLNLLAVYSNRALGGQPVPESAVVHAQKAAELAPPSAEAYRHAAIVFACAAKERPELIEPAIQYLEKAVAHGLNPASLRTHPAFSALSRQVAFQALLSKPPGREPSVAPAYLVDPL
jgi:tetratricopeptide (TPR) repeat protein